MSKLLDLIQRMSDGSPAPLGFGAARAGNVPGMALLGRASRPARGRRPRGLSQTAIGHLDAAIVADAAGAEQLTQLADSLSELPWGVAVSVLTETEAQACRDAGADLVAFPLEGTAVAALAGDDDLARLLSVAADPSDRELRAIAALPVDCLVLDMKRVSSPWTLQDLVQVGSVSRRVDKHILVEVATAPGAQDLEALRDMGVNGLIVDLASVGGTDLAGLKTRLLEMPRPRPRRRERRNATVPGAGFAPARPPAREDDDDDFDECRVVDWRVNA